MAETADLRVTVQIGQQYVAICDQFLTEQLGRPYTLPEISQFAETSIATLLASAYTNFREAMGKDAAEAWLKKTLAVGASTARLLGADALLRFEVHIKDMPNKLHQQRQEMKSQPQPAAEAPAPEPKCTCQLTDGSCAPCSEVLSNIFKGTFIFMRKMGDAVKKGQEICQACHQSQTDRALASIVPQALSLEVPAENKEAFQQEILAVLHQMGAAHGAHAIPLTEKAFQDAVKA